MKIQTKAGLLVMALAILGNFGLIEKVNASTQCANGIEHNIMIHGIGGSDASFGSMDNALTRNMECSKSHFFVYETKDRFLTNNDFAKSLSLFLNNIPKTKDKDINLIMHSQGGLVGLTFLMNSFDRLKGYNHAHLKRINHFVTMSTPFWGSDFALMGGKVFFNFNLTKNGISPFGEVQLEDMEYGSVFNQTQQNKIFKRSSSEFLHFLKNEVKILNISGMAPFSKRFMRNIDSQFFEGDLIVNIPSMNLNTLYASTDDLDYNSNTSQSLDTKKITIGQQAYATGTHLEVYYGTLGHGIVDVPRDCVDISECEHPGFLTLFNFLNSTEVLSSERIEKIIKGFDLHVKVTFPKEVTSLEKSFINLTSKNKLSVDLSHYRMNINDYEPISINKKTNTAYYLLKGNIWSSLKSTQLEFKINHQEIEPRTLSLEVEKGKATFLDTNVKLKKN